MFVFYVQIHANSIVVADKYKICMHFLHTVFELVNGSFWIHRSALSSLTYFSIESSIGTALWISVVKLFSPKIARKRTTFFRNLTSVRFHQHLKVFIFVWGVVGGGGEGRWGRKMGGWRIASRAKALFVRPLRKLYA